MIHLVLAITLLVISHIASLSAMTERKYSVQKTVGIYGVFYIVFICLIVVAIRLFNKDIHAISVSFLGTIVVGFVVFMLTSADPFCKKVFLFISYSNVFCILQCMTVIIGALCFPALSVTGALYAKNILRTLLYIPTIWLYIRFLRPAVREVPGTKKKTWYSISLVSLLFLLVFAVFQTVIAAHQDHAESSIPWFVVVTLIYCAVLWVIFGTIRYMSQESKMELASKNAEYLQGQLALARENELFAKTIRHDFRHHNQNIAVMLEQGDIPAALHYIQQYSESLDVAKSNEICAHVTVNAILNNFCNKASSEGISVSVSADTPEESAIADMDFVAILSNLLENAINGCKACHVPGEITVNIRTVADKTVIVCSNPCHAETAIENNMLKKKGVGIDSMMAAAKKYDGDINYEKENGVLTVCVILKP